MGLIAKELKDLRKMLRDYEKGKLTAEDVQIKLSIYKESYKRAQFALAMHIACNKPHRIENKMHDLGLISKGETAQTSEDVEIEMILCPNKNDKAITRAECFSFSGDAKNYEGCKTCSHFGITRNLIAP